MSTVVHLPEPSDTLPRTSQSAWAGPASPTSALFAMAAAVGPALLLGSSVAWAAGDGSEELRGILQFWSFPFFALAAVGVAARLERSSPVGRAVITAMLAVGAAGGAAFANEINMVEHFGTERLLRQDTPSALVALGIPGVLFPIGLMATGALSVIHRTLPRWQAALLAIGGLLFPLSRIPEVAGLAVLADTLLLAAMAPIAVAAVSRRGR